MSYEINKVLETLEKNLQKVDSARGQVENTIKAYTELQVNIKNYTDGFQELCKDVRTLIDTLVGSQDKMSENLKNALSSLDKACDSIVKTFNADCDKIVSSFETKVDGKIENLKGCIDIFNNNLKDLNQIEIKFSSTIEQVLSIKGKIENIDKTLEESQSSQDNTLKEIDKILTKLSTIEENIGELGNSINEGIDKLRNELDKKLKAIETKNDENLKVLIQKIEENNNSIEFNKTLLIIVIVLAIINIVIKFI